MRCPRGDSAFTENGPVHLTTGRTGVTIKTVNLTERATWRNFPVMVQQFEVELLQPFRLPPYAGSLLRGALGWSLKEVCPEPIYSYLFETSSEVAGQKDAVRPFLLVPPQGRHFKAGDRFQFTLKLLGQGCEYTHEFARAVVEAGRFGLGQERARFELVKIVTLEGPRTWVSYDRNLGWSAAYFPLPSALGAFASTKAGGPVREIILNFETPTLLVHQGRKAEQPPFHVVLRALYRRLDSLLCHHAGLNLEVPFREDIQAAQQVESHFELEWVDWERSSYRQRRRHKMGGVMGRASYRGRFKAEWLELLGAGQVIHLGKATTFGMGCYQLQVQPLPAIRVKGANREAIAT